VRAVRALAVVVAGALGSGCTDKGTAPADLEIHALPSSVTPLGETTLALVVRGGCAGSSAACSLCVGVMPPADGSATGTLVAPSLGVTTSGAVPLQLTPPSADTPFTLLYRAPNLDGSEVVYATLYHGMPTCPVPPSPDDDGGPAGTTPPVIIDTSSLDSIQTVEITISGTVATAVSDAGAGDATSTGDAEN
jgi:hypothetical protein